MNSCSSVFRNESSEKTSKRQIKISCPWHEYLENIKSFLINSFKDEYRPKCFYSLLEVIDCQHSLTWVKITLYCKNHQWKINSKLRCHIYYEEQWFHSRILKLHMNITRLLPGHWGVFTICPEKYITTCSLSSPPFGSNLFLCFWNCPRSPPRQPASLKESK